MNIYFFNLKYMKVTFLKMFIGIIVLLWLIYFIQTHTDKMLY
jgi:hypothetical protein